VLSGAAVTRHRLDDLDLVAGLFDQVADVDHALVAGAGFVQLIDLHARVSVHYA
jgi:hypothetical protein